MSFSRLILREIFYRKLSFCLGVFSAAAAVAGFVVALIILERFDQRTERIIAAKEEETRAKMAVLEDDYRKMMLKMGFNVLIMPKEQNLADLYADDFASKYMPEEYATRLAQSRVATINHILPSLQQKLNWSEYGRTVLLMGVRSEVYVQSKQQRPMIEPVATGTMVLGCELARNFRLGAGEKAKLLGREFSVAKINAARGNKDDITVWINLAEAQELLDKRGLINGILALDCTCDTVDRLSRIRGEILGVLPDTQVIEFASQALARAEARQRAAAEAQAAIARERQNRAMQREEREAMAARVVPIVALVAALWTGLLAFNNVRERRAEIGVLRALGVRSRQILAVFLGRAVLIGLAGACLGYAVGVLVGEGWKEGPGAGLGTAFPFGAQAVVAILASAALVTGLAGWIPAWIAAHQDPADALKEG